MDLQFETDQSSPFNKKKRYKNMFCSRDFRQMSAYRYKVLSNA